MSDLITVQDMCLWYGQTQALKNISIRIPEKSITFASRGRWPSSRTCF